MPARPAARSRQVPRPVANPACACRGKAGPALLGLGLGLVLCLGLGQGQGAGFGFAHRFVALADDLGGEGSRFLADKHVADTSLLPG